MIPLPRTSRPLDAHPLQEPLRPPVGFPKKSVFFSARAADCAAVFSVFPDKLTTLLLLIHLRRLGLSLLSPARC
jgi:hypothetical protein